MIHPAAVLTAMEIHREAAARPPADIVVRRGDSLSGIAARYRIVWPGLYEANRGAIGGTRSISPGQHLRIPTAAQAERLALKYRPVEATPPRCPPSRAAPTQPVAEQASSSGSGAPAGSFQQCVISRESGGNSQVMNSTGHYGLYQFDDADLDR